MVVGIVAYYYYMKHRGGSDWTTPNPLYMKVKKKYNSTSTDL